MVRRLLNFLRKPFLGLPDSVQPIVIRELDDMESIHQDFTNHGFSVIVLRPEHTVTQPNETPFGPYWPHPEQCGPGGYL
ncbi:hypothetical protein [Mycobacteroides abscessus]|uniref:hypothetical protein n=1 Tax=Mycobacteroides abscessus TaxID=36809 RepID=UPI0009A5AB9F|nr:hypothetical protein [Mycobacteroides abscessus]SKR73170.1 Uncharacterised protein [Mycobacteroides abscessus subsp. massiliense]